MRGSDNLFNVLTDVDFSCPKKADNQTDIGPALMKAFGCAQKAITTRASDTVILVPAGMKEPSSIESHFGCGF